MKYIGVDVGKNRCQACIMDEEGEILDEFPFTNTWEGIQALLEKTGDTKSKAVVESTGNLWLRIYEALEGHGVEVKLANPYKTKAIASARIKTDKLSARILAHLLRADLVAARAIVEYLWGEKKGERDVILPIDILYKEIGKSLSRNKNIKKITFSRTLMHIKGEKAIDITFGFNELWGIIIKSSEKDCVFEYIRNSVKILIDFGQEIKNEIEMEFSDIY